MSALPIGRTVATDADRPTVLRVDDLRTVIHTPRGPVRAVDGVSLTLRRGETLGLVGESGSGKSVLGRSIMGLYRSGSAMTVSGQVLFEDRDVHAMAPHDLRALWGSGIGMVFQDPLTALNPVKRIGRHLTETLRRHQDVSARWARTRAVDLLGLVGIPDPRRRAEQYPHELSGGMRQRVVIAMALANDPALVIADEPTTALDVTVQSQILDLLDRLQAELGLAILLISHNLGVVAGRAERVAVMYGGRVVETAAAGEVFAAPAHPYTGALLSAIPRLHDPAHRRLRAIDGAPPDLARPSAGCRFAPRCPAVQDDCRTTQPALLPLGRPAPANPGAQHRAACLHPNSAPLGDAAPHGEEH
ncbi:ABC transporter ATP-binding protein [Nocardioides sambongensis]|uniref:ABC transporter ATP-binding protein n=1 Tax=Nocardioides sambongensis TaxID=2589074 RepID=UPI001127AF28|nr:ABC transporter ATP-binding protein [Nocardioides sambongensis]